MSLELKCCSPSSFQYAAIFLAHFDRNEFEKLTKTLVSHVDVEGVLKMCSSMTNTVFDNQCQEEGMNSGFCFSFSPSNRLVSKRLD